MRQVVVIDEAIVNLQNTPSKSMPAFTGYDVYSCYWWKQQSRIRLNTLTGAVATTTLCKARSTAYFCASISAHRHTSTFSCCLLQLSCNHQLSCCVDLLVGGLAQRLCRNCLDVLDARLLTVICRGLQEKAGWPTLTREGLTLVQPMHTKQPWCPQLGPGQAEGKVLLSAQLLRVARQRWSS